jgi:hypothetical protein
LGIGKIGTYSDPQTDRNLFPGRHRWYWLYIIRFTTFLPTWGLLYSLIISTFQIRGNLVWCWIISSEQLESISQANTYICRCIHGGCQLQISVQIDSHRWCATCTPKSSRDWISLNSKTPSQFCQWEFQEPKIKVLYHVNLALAQALYMVGTSNQSVPDMAIDVGSCVNWNQSHMCCQQPSCDWFHPYLVNHVPSFRCFKCRDDDCAMIAKLHQLTIPKCWGLLLGNIGIPIFVGSPGSLCGKHLLQPTDKLLLRKRPPVKKNYARRRVWSELSHELCRLCTFMYYIVT